MLSKCVCSFVQMRLTCGAYAFCLSHACASHVQHMRFSSRANTFACETLHTLCLTGTVSPSLSLYLCPCLCLSSSLAYLPIPAFLCPFSFFLSSPFPVFLSSPLYLFLSLAFPFFSSHCLPLFISLPLPLFASSFTLPLPLFAFRALSLRLPPSPSL